MFYMWDMPLGMGWWMAFSGLWMVVFWGGLIAFIVWGITRLDWQKDLAPKNGPMDIAKERYVKGEIFKEEFEQIKKDLS